MDWVNSGLSPKFSDRLGVSPKFSNSLIFVIVKIYGLRVLGLESEEPPDEPYLPYFCFISSIYHFFSGRIFCGSMKTVG
jgi:hypothetical protein